MTQYTFMSIADVCAAIGQGKSAIYERMDPKSDSYDPDFPKSLVLSRRCVRWRSDEIQAWMDSKSENRTVGRAERVNQAKAAAAVKKAKNAKPAASELAGQG